MHGFGYKRHDERLRGLGKPRFVIIGLITFLALILPSATAFAAGPAVCLYRVGDRGQEGVALIKRYLETKGYQVSLYQGEETIESHAGKVSLINRSGATVFLAVIVKTSAKSDIMVARTEASKGDGRFLTVDEIPERFSEDSQALAEAVAGAFGVKVKRMPLFPLLGVTAPGIFLYIRGPEADMTAVAKNLHLGLEAYFSKGLK